MTTIDIAVTPNWIDIKAEYSLIEGQVYILDNTSGDIVYTRQSVTEPTKNKGHLLQIKEDRILIIGSEGTWVRSNDSAATLRISLFGNLPIMPHGEYLHEVVKGTFPGKTTMFKFARTDTVTTDETIIWDGAAETEDYEFPTIVSTVTVVSDDPVDTAAGIGARLVIIFGLDEDRNEIFDLIPMTGTDPVTTTQTYARLYRMIVLTCGTNSVLGGANHGTITATHTTGGQLLAQMHPHKGQTLMGIYTVPAGKTLNITGLSLSVGRGKDCTFYVRTRNGETADDSFSVKYSLELYETAFTTPLTAPVRISEKVDMVVTALTSVGTVAASASWGGVVEDN